MYSEEDMRKDEELTELKEFKSQRCQTKTKKVKSKGSGNCADNAKFYETVSEKLTS